MHCQSVLTKYFFLFPIKNDLHSVLYCLLHSNIKYFGSIIYNSKSTRSMENLSPISMYYLSHLSHVTRYLLTICRHSKLETWIVNYVHWLEYLKKLNINFSGRNIVILQYCSSASFPNLFITLQCGFGFFF